jgi:chitodextrinase
MPNLCLKCLKGPLCASHSQRRFVSLSGAHGLREWREVHAIAHHPTAHCERRWPLYRNCGYRCQLQRYRLLRPAEPNPHLRMELRRQYIRKRCQSNPYLHGGRDLYGHAHRHRYEQPYHHSIHQGHHCNCSTAACSKCWRSLHRDCRYCSSFSGAASTDPQGQTLAYAWNFRDNTTASGISPTHIYTAAGTFTITLTVTNTSNLTAIAMTKAIIVAAPQPPVASAGGPYTGTVGTAVSFSGVASTDPQGQILTYVWNFGDNSTGSGVSPTHTYTLAGS